MVAKNGEFFSQPILGRDSKRACRQRRRLAAGLVFEKRRARLQSPVKKVELKIILNQVYKGRPEAAAIKDLRSYFHVLVK